MTAQENWYFCEVYAYISQLLAQGQQHPILQEFSFCVLHQRGLQFHSEGFGAKYNECDLATLL